MPYRSTRERVDNHAKHPRGADGRSRRGSHHVGPRFLQDPLATFLRAKAAQLITLSGTMTPGPQRDRLVALARELARKADELDGDDPPPPRN